MSTVMQAYPVVLQWNYEQGIVHADANPAQTDKIQDYTYTTSDGVKHQAIDNAFITAFLNSPAGNGQTLAQKNNVTASTVTWGDLKDLTGIDLSASANPGIAAAMANLPTSQYDGAPFLSYWLRDWGPRESPMAAAIFYAIGQAKNATTLDISGIFPSTQSVGGQTLGKVIASLINNAGSITPTSNVQAGSGDLAALLPKLTSVDVSYNGFTGANDIQDWSWLSQNTSVTMYVGNTGTWVDSWRGWGNDQVKNEIVTANIKQDTALPPST